MANIKIFALGGLGENGKNMYVVEVNEHIFILDAGLKYPDIDMYGVDAVIADVSYLVENKDRIEGIFISHGHEDHVNALPYLLKMVPSRVYGTHFTISLIENLLLNNQMNIQDYKLFRINENKVLKFKEVSVSFFNTTHSIPESVAIAINTSDGAVVYCTDFNFGLTNYGKFQTSFDKITDLGKKKVLALLTESLGAGTLNRVKNDSLLEHQFKNILASSKGRIIVSTYSSDLTRIQKIISLSLEKNKRIAIVGRKAEKIVDVAIKSNYLSIKEDEIVKLSPSNIDTTNMDKDLVILSIGVRNEPYNSLVRMAQGEDKLIKLVEDDHVIFMCPPVPGTEKYSIYALNTLYRYDANVHIFDKNTLKSSHANAEDLKLLYAMLKPKYIIPVKGEYRHMYDQYLVAKEADYKDENILLLENGVAAVFEDGVYTKTMDIPVGDIFVDGSLLGMVNEEVIQTREKLAEEGAIILTLNYDIRLRKVVSAKDIVLKGLSYNIPYEDLNNKVNDLASKILNNNLVKKKFDLPDITKTIETEISNLVFRLTKHRPVIIPFLVEVSK